MYEVIITTPYNVIHYYVDSINNSPELDEILSQPWVEETRIINRMTDIVVAIQEETFNTIKIYGFGTVLDKKNGMFRVKLEDGDIVMANSVVKASDWAAYVDERGARIERIDVKCKKLER